MVAHGGASELTRLAAPPRPEPTHRPGYVRTALLGLLLVLMLVVSTAFALLRMERTAREAGPDANARAAAQDALGAVAARADSAATRLDTALSAGAAVITRFPANPLDAAEAALAAARPAARAVAVVSDEGVRGAAGDAGDADWAEAARMAQASGHAYWFGRGAKTPQGQMFAARGVVGPTGRVEIVALADLGAAAAKGADGVAAVLLVTPQGQIVSAHGRGGATQSLSLREALQITPDELKTDGPALGELPDGTTVSLTIRKVAGGGLYAIAATPRLKAAVDPRKALTTNLFFLVAPLAIGCGLALLLLVQVRRAETVQRAFAESERRFRLAVEAARCGIWEWDLDADEVFMSDVTGAILGWGGGGLAPGADVLGRIGAEHRDRVRQTLAAARTYGAFDVSFRVPDAAGRSTWIDARGQAFGDAGASGFTRIIGVMLDVTEERSAQARAQAAETRLRDAIDSVSEAFVLWDRAGRLLMCNKSYRAFFNLEPRILKPGAARGEVNRFVRLAVKQTHKNADGLPGLFEAEMNDGRWLQISERRTADGGMVMTAADITAIKLQDEARRLNEEALREVVENLEYSQRQLADVARKYETEKVRAEGANKAKSEFLANMSHELRTPLNAINGFSEIMVGEMFGPLGDRRYKEYSQDILSSGQHLLALINDILDMSKIEAGKMNLSFERMHLSDVVEDAVRLVKNRADSTGLTMDVDLPETLPEIEADYRALKQVLLNLLSNALKFTPQGGRVSVTADTRGDQMTVRVTDTGIGISAEDLARLAKPFEQIESQHSKTQQGTGLGLALTKSLVEMHDGRLDMTSRPGEGTMVSFTIPMRRAAVPVAGSYAA